MKADELLTMPSNTVLPDTAKTIVSTEDAERSFSEGVGDAIRASRKVLGWTQADLAERASLSPNYVARIERGEVSPSLWVTHRIASAMSTTLDALIIREKSAPPLVQAKIARKFQW